MKSPARGIFVDSDVVISAAISNLGAGFALLSLPHQSFTLSTYSTREILIVSKRLRIEERIVQSLLKSATVITIHQSIAAIKKKYAHYTIDPNDTHIIAGAVQSKARFLITYNMKHYIAERLYRDYQIILYTPGQYLQYLRSIS